MPRQLHHEPAVEPAALVQQLWVERVADERRECVTLDDQVLRDGLGHAVPDEPPRHPFGPVFAPPDPLALRVVETALEHGRAGSPNRRCGAADMVGVKVRDGDPLDRQRRPRRLAEPRPVSKSVPSTT